MAVTSGSADNATVKTILEIQTEKSTQSVSNLRKEIKNLKDQLLSLDKTSEQYRQTLSELADKQHELKELNEEISRSSSDFGDRITNLTGVLQGGVASITGMTSALSLLGVNIGSSDKLMKKLVSSIALLQSLKSIDEANKSFKRLITSVRLTSVSVKSLSAELKAFAASNPLTAILAAATALVGVLASVMSKIKEAKEGEAAMALAHMNSEFEKIKTSSAAIKEQMEQMYNVLKNGSTEEIKAAWDITNENAQRADKYLKKYQEDIIKLRQNVVELAKANNEALNPNDFKVREKALKAYRDAEIKLILNLEAEIEKEEEKLDKADQAKIARLQAQITEENAYLEFMQQEDKIILQIKESETLLSTAKKQNNETDEQSIENYKKVYDIWAELDKMTPGKTITESMQEIPIPELVKNSEDAKAAIDLVTQSISQLKHQMETKGSEGLFGEEQMGKVKQNVALALANADKQRREAARKAREQWKTHLNELLGDYRRWLALRKRENELALRQEELDNKKQQQRRDTNWGTNGGYREDNKWKSTSAGKSGHSDVIADMIRQRDIMRANFDDQTESINHTIEIIEAYIKKLEAIKNPTKEVKQAIEDANNDLAEQRILLEELVMTRAEEVKASNLAIDTEVKAYRERMNSAKAIENEAELLKELTEITEKYAWSLDESQANHATFWNAYGSAGRDNLDLDKEIEELQLQLSKTAAQLKAIEQQRRLLEQNKIYQMQRGIFDQSEYEQQMADLQLQQTEIEAQQSQARIQIAENEIKKKKNLQENMLSFMSGIASAMTSVLDAMADQEDISFEDQKKLKIASAVISTIEGGIAGFMSGINSGIPAPYNYILAAATAASVLATGFAQVRKIEQTTKDNASSTASSGAVSSKIVASPPEIVNLNGTNSDNIELPDQRVYVLESDISSAQRRVRVAENNSEF